MKFGNYDDEAKLTPDSPSYFDNDQNSLDDGILNSININTATNFTNHIAINNLHLYQNSSLFPISDYGSHSRPAANRKRYHKF